MVVAIIEPNRYERTAELMKRLRDVICNLVMNDGAYVFLFTNAGQFDSDCYTIISQLKKLYPNIKRHYFHGGCDYDVGYVDWMANFYDKLHFPKQGVALSRHMRDCALVDKCDTVVTCGNVQVKEYARKKNKYVIAL